MRYRILLCLPRHAAFLNPMNRALRSLDHQVQIFDYQTGSLITYLLGVTTNVLHVGPQFKRQINALIQKQLIKLSYSFKPHLILVIKGETIFPETIHRLTDAGFITVNWYPDWLAGWDWVKVNAPSYTLFASSCFDLYRKLKQRLPRSIYLPYAAAPDAMRNTIKSYPISFVGQYTPRRERFFAPLVDLGLQIWGYSSWKNSRLRHQTHSQISPEETLAVFRKSKIVVNVLTGNDEFQPSTVNNRTFETLGVGTFLLVQNHPILYKHFSPGKDFITFKTPDELRKKAEYYLTCDKERERIATSGWRKVQKQHKYQQRFKQLFAKLAL